MSRIIKAGLLPSESQCLVTPAAAPDPTPPRAAFLLDSATIIRSATERAANIVRGAEKAAADMMLDAETRLQERQQEAIDQGYEAGYTRGLEEGRQHAREEIEVQASGALRSLRKAEEEIRQLRQDIVAAAEADIIKFAVLIAERMVRAELDNPERTLDIARSILAEVQDESRVRVYLPPGVLEEVGGGGDALGHLAVAAGMQVQIEVDPALHVGDVRVESQWGWIDGRGAIRWRRLVEAMERGVAGDVS